VWGPREGSLYLGPHTEGSRPKMFAPVPCSAGSQGPCGAVEKVSPAEGAHVRRLDPKCARLARNRACVGSQRLCGDLERVRCPLALTPKGAHVRGLDPKCSHPVRARPMVGPQLSGDIDTGSLCFRRPHSGGARRVSQRKMSAPGACRPDRGAPASWWPVLRVYPCFRRPHSGAHVESQHKSRAAGTCRPDVGSRLPVDVDTSHCVFGALFRGAHVECLKHKSRVRYVQA
jgi:hypothetical protein